MPDETLQRVMERFLLAETDDVDRLAPDFVSRASSGEVIKLLKGLRSRYKEQAASTRRISRALQISTEEANVANEELRQEHAELLKSKNIELEAQREQLVVQQEELVAVNRELAEAKAAAEDANRSKSEFLANMSHEIRTPMTAILGFAELMLDPGQSPAERRECINTINRNGRHLLTIINDVLDLSEIEAGRLKAERVECAPRRIIAEVASLMQERAIGKGLSFDVEYAEAVPRTVRSDPTRLRQILLNLVGNAVKFTEKGGVRVVVGMDDGADTSKPRLRFEIVDTGIGMDGRARVRLFKPFEQADTSTTREFGGTGLGLTISKRLAEMLGGDIAVRSTPGQGSSFSLTIDADCPTDVEMVQADPVNATSPSPGEQVREQSRQELPPKARILLAEDGPDNQRLISLLLRKAGADVTVAENGRAAVDRAMAAAEAGEPFGLILMDMQMPVMDGYHATAELRGRGYTGPIVALTAHAMQDDRQKCLQAGCDDFVSKPVEHDKLLQTVASHLGDDTPAASL